MGSKMSRVESLKRGKTLNHKLLQYKGLRLRARGLGPNSLSRRRLELKANAFPDVVSVANTPRRVIWRGVP